MTYRVSEGVIQFVVEHRRSPLEERVHGDVARELAAWRELLARLGLIGRDPGRYEGLGYGNVSARVPPFGDVGRGRRAFLVSGTQTGGLARLTLAHFCRVEAYDVAANRVRSVGASEPSSESLTHAALYDVAPDARAVLHGHTPELWRHAAALHVPITAPAIAQGTVAMAHEVQRLYRETTFASVRIAALGGHEDGVLAFGRSVGEAGETLVRYLGRALEHALERT